MWISFYNRDGIGDTLLLSSGVADRYHVTTTTKEDVTEIFDQQTKRVVGYNIANISSKVPLEANGVFTLTAQQVEDVTAMIEAAGFSVDELDLTPKATLVVGLVEECVAHPDSDHLSITQTRVADDVVLQIVCGAPNVKTNQKVVVATAGTVMPNGAEIWEGELRGVKSAGMLCSARELGLSSDSQTRGILVLEDDAVVGSPFTA